ncbi:MAG: hypothetical protein U9R39_10580 [Campylobacterota bacterium]|nr:hypothetical protein [Campylobacterota bacterium]
MLKILILLVMSILFTGCSNLLPSAEKTSVSHWGSYDDIFKSYTQVKEYKTTKAELHKLGFNPFSTPNIKILNHLDIKKKFLITSSIKMKDLDNGVQECIKSKNQCIAYEAIIKYTKRKRYGSVMLDLFNFRKNTRETGWIFSALVIINNDMVVYKLSNSKPKIDSKERKKNPLGPFQSMESVLRATVR